MFMKTPAWLLRSRRELRLAMDRMIDRHWGIATIAKFEPLSPQADEFDRAQDDAFTSYYLLYQFLGPSLFLPTDVFYDIGCGNGRVLCRVARNRIAKVVGIELSPRRAAEARANAETLRGR